jgi:putative ABC transport system permease protein
VNELAQGVKTLSGDADFEVRGPRGGFPEGLYPEIARLPDVAVASPVVEVDAKVAGRDASLRIVGVDVFRAAYLQPGMIPATVDRLDTLRSDALFLSPAALRSLNVAVGDTLRVQVALRDVTLRVAGELAAAGNQRFGLMDIAAAQAAFDRIGLLARIDVRLRPGVAPEAFEKGLRAMLPPGVDLVRPETAVAAGASLSRSYRVNLNVLALVALFTGALLVFSTQTHAVVRRRQELALLRVLGITRNRLTLTIVAEGAIVGVAGSALGLVAGFALAQLAVRSYGADLGSGFFRGVTPSLALEPVALGTFFALGVLASVAGSFVPAYEAARASPAQALKAGDDEAMYARLRPVKPALVLMALGAAATAFPSEFARQLPHNFHRF